MKESHVPRKAEATALEKMLRALVAYAERHEGSLNVNASFVVPNEKDWPSDLWGMELGRAVRSARELEALARNDEVRSRGQNGVSEREFPMLPRLSRTPWGKRLTSVGFDWGDTAKDRKYRLCLAALEAYASEHGDLVLPRNFRVPAREPYPPALHNANLDRAVYSIRFYRDLVADYPDRQAELRALGFVWQRLQPEFNLIVEALVVFKTIYGHLDIPVAFIVPSSKTNTTELSKWPLATHGMPLGRLCAQIRHRHDFVLDAQKWIQLDNLGFIWSAEHRRKTEIGDALAIYRQLYGGNTIPRVAYVVPQDGQPKAEYWPKHLRGYRLGRRLYDSMRRGGLDLTTDKPLAAVTPIQNGNRTDRNFDLFAKALTVYVQTYGHADVPQKFCVPSDDEAWPRECAGMPLGSRVAQIRSKGHYVNGNHPRAKRRKAILDALGFRWKNKDINL
uniref:Helicase-associated domain-containing protein n=1 Tax=Aureoumbra lagunensis TaxID=44058 RepID=A0A7S3K0M6_9STRA